MIQIACKEHPKYKAKHQPKVECYTCWFLWKLRTEGAVAPYRFKVLDE